MSVDACSKSKLVGRRDIARRWGRDRRGTTAIEFALVVGPFFLFVFGIIGIGLQFFTITSLEHGVESAARKIRTGEAQKAGKTLSDFKQMVCAAAGSYIKCDNSLIVHVQTANTWSGIVPRPCLTGGALTPSAGVDNDPLANSSGTASAAVLVTACYEWKMPQSFRFLKMGDMANGSALIQAATTFRTEPYQ